MSIFDLKGEILADTRDKVVHACLQLLCYEVFCEAHGLARKGFPASRGQPKADIDEQTCYINTDLGAQ